MKSSQIWGFALLLTFIGCMAVGWVKTAYPILYYRWLNRVCGWLLVATCGAISLGVVSFSILLISGWEPK